MDKQKKKFSAGKIVGLGLGGIVLLSVISNGVNNSSKSVQDAQKHSVTTQPASTDLSKQATIDTTETKTEIKTEVIPFASTTANDATLSAGTQKVTVAGVNGEKQITYSVTFKNGVEKGRKVLSSTITRQPVNQITSVGTKQAASLSCPNGTYVNSLGNTVCSPYESSGAPADATAICGDNSYSFSQSRSGTCSHHGGVAEWL